MVFNKLHKYVSNKANRMGKILTKIKECALPSHRRIPSQLNNQYIQILVVGDKGVGKSTLVNNYVSDILEEDDPNLTFLLSQRGRELSYEGEGFSSQSSDSVIVMDEDSKNLSIAENITLPETPRNTKTAKPSQKTSQKVRHLSANQLLYDPQTNQNYNVNLTIIDINGEISSLSQQLRESYYRTSNIIFVVYNVGKVKSLFHAKKIWSKEIEEATKKLCNDKPNDKQLVLVGVNPEMRDKYQESQISALDFDSHHETLVDRRTRHSSVRKGDGEEVAKVLKYRNSTRKTKHRELKNQRADIHGFFEETVRDYVLTRD